MRYTIEAIKIPGTEFTELTQGIFIIKESRHSNLIKKLSYWKIYT